MSISDKLLTLIDSGRAGDNFALSTGMPKLEKYIDGVSQETYYLVAGGTGAGKTSFVIYSFIYRPIMEKLNDNDYHVIYISLEMTAEQLLAKLLSLYIWETYGVELSFKDLLSRGKDNKLSDINYELVTKSLDTLKKIESHLIISTKLLDPQGIKEFVLEQLKKFGTFNNNIYTLSNPKHIIEVVIDHIGCVKGPDKKKVIDETSSIMRELRNRCRITPVVVMQINRGASNVERRKLDMQELQLDDLKGSGNPAEDANVVLALFYPFREKMSKYRGYDIKKLGSNFRSVVILKNRFGSADISDGLGFYGSVGLFKELPKSAEIMDYEKYKYPDWILKNEEEVKEDNKVKMTLTL
jgi:replicative DNA helicase